jgi:hypothetical protein
MIPLTSSRNSNSGTIQPSGTKQNYGTECQQRTLERLEDPTEEPEHLRCPPVVVGQTAPVPKVPADVIGELVISQCVNVATADTRERLPRSDVPSDPFLATIPRSDAYGMLRPRPARQGAAN